jgi:hypothetical protein
MHVRVTTVTRASDIDEGLGFLRDVVLPQLQHSLETRREVKVRHGRIVKGFRSLIASGDRSAGVVSVLSVWDSEQARQASESEAEGARGSDLMRRMGGQVRVARYEQTIWEVGETLPGPGAKEHIQSIKMDPSRVDDNVAFFRQNLLPDIKVAHGFLGVRYLIDPSSGEGRVVTLWADEESLSSAVAMADQSRGIAAERGVEFGEEDTVLEILFAAL